MTTLAWHPSTSKGSLTTLPILVLGLLLTTVAIPNALHGKLPFGTAMLGSADLLRAVPAMTIRASNETVALLDEDDDSFDDQATSTLRFEPLSDPSAKKADPAANPMLDAQPLHFAHRGSAHSRHAHHHGKTHRKLVRAHR